MKYYIIAGEASGDLHGSNLIQCIRELDAESQIRCWGGDRMASAGGSLAKHYRDLAFMGLFEVLANFRAIKKNFRYCKSDVINFDPDLLIFIDYSGFNLRIAEWAKRKGFYTSYYISPQVWASRAKRVEKIKKCIDQMYVILPFEKKFYQEEYQHRVHFVGHPLLDEIGKREFLDKEVFRRKFGLDDRKIIAVLPGSRTQEISRMLPPMCSVADSFPDCQFVIAGAPNQDHNAYKQFIDKENIRLIDNSTYSLLNASHAAVVASGTATLETALFKVPQVVCYKGNWLTHFIAKRIFTRKYICLVNLIMDKQVVPELIQANCNFSTIEAELARVLDEEERRGILMDYDALEIRIGGVGASMRAAKIIIEHFRIKKAH
ncbi:lipid-A-disaccharide synthase [Puniceicoccaceae bacterium K14]|nr:lipid-A-disaccharide synthase [Puniceicoccaceae bacterium K14]